MTGVYCPAAAARCHIQKCIAARAESKQWNCPRTLPERKAQLTRVAYEKREADAVRRIWSRYK